MSKVLHNIFWATASSWIQQAFTFITVLFVARMVSPSAFGVIAVALLFILLFQRLLLESIGYLVVREDSESCDQSFLDSAYFLAVICSLILAGIIYIGSGYLAGIFDMPDLSLVLKVLAIMPIFDGLCMVQTALFRRNMQFKFITLRTAFVNLLSGCTGIALAFANYDIWALVWQQVIGSLTGCVVIFVSSDWRPGRHIRSVIVKDLLLRSFPMMGNAIMFVMTNRIDIMMLGLFSTPAITGFYSLAKRVTRTIIDLFVSGVNSVSLTTFSQYKNDVKQLSIQYRTNLQFVSLVVYPCFFGFISIAGELVPLVLGDKWLPIVPMVEALSITGILQVIVMFLSNVAIARGLTRELFYINISSFIFLAVIIFLVVEYGGQWVAYSFVCQNFLTVFLLFCILSARGIHLLISTLHSIWKTILCCFVMLLIVFLCKDFFQHFRLLFQVVILAMIGSIVYVVMIFFIQRQFIVSVALKLKFNKKTDLAFTDGRM